jgi:hypothetical protein
MKKKSQVCFAVTWSSDVFDRGPELGVFLWVVAHY